MGGGREFDTRMYVSHDLMILHGLSLTRCTDGAARIGATLFGELLNAVFARVGQRAVRKVTGLRFRSSVL
jgi:hypothetical protein